MKISKLLNKTYLTVIFISFLIISDSFSENEPVDIWNIDKKEIEENSQNLNEISNSGIDPELNKIDVFNMQTTTSNNLIELDNSLNSKETKLIGLYDPEDYGLKIDMWTNSNGDQIKYIFSNLAKIDLSEDAAELMNIILLTNAYPPKKKYKSKRFFKDQIKLVNQT